MSCNFYVRSRTRYDLYSFNRDNEALLQRERTFKMSRARSSNTS